MPRVKIDYIVSFSSEDSENQANNLLSPEVSKRRWLCRAGEPSCSVVLQLACSVQISAVHVGAHHAALVEVLVGRSETPHEPFQEMSEALEADRVHERSNDIKEVLVPSCVFVGPAESRRDPAVDRVRSFSADQLAPAAGQRWDRVRLVCSQPYNKHCKYGLSFVHIYSPEEPRAGPPPAPAPAAAARRWSSDEESYRPGQLFARAHAAAPDTGAQIRQATSQVLKKITDSSTKLVKTPIAKQKRSQAADRDEATTSDRGRDSLVYTADDDRPHDKIDRLLHRHYQDKDKRDKDKNKHDDRETASKQTAEHKQSGHSRAVKRRDSGDGGRDRQPPARNRRPHEESASPPHEDRVRAGPGEPARKRPRSADQRDSARSTSPRPGPVSSAPHTLLAGVGVVLSGYQNPSRAQHRNTAMALGARVLPAWTAGATHLVCAFPNTPKLREVRAAPGGAAVPVVLADWLEQTAEHRRRLPWQWFATEPARRLAAPPGWEDEGHDGPDDTPASRSDREVPADDCDTDDEIEKVMRRQKRARSESASASEDGDSERTAPRADDDTDVEDAPPLPDLFAGRSFLIEEEAGGALLARYILAYGGLVLSGSLEDHEEVDYVVTARGAAGGRRGAAGGRRRVRPDWVWRCHAARRRLPAGGDA